jgi:nucleoside-diphosphate-sugar epimerase
MRVLLIGGSGFIGPHVAMALRRLGHDVAVLHRGKTPAPSATTIVGNRNDLASSIDRLRAFGPDVVVDLILSSGRQARELMALFRGHAGRVVALSSCDVYRACGVLHGSEDGPLEPLPLTESSTLRKQLQTYPPQQLEALRRVFGWLDDEYDKIPVEQAILSEPDLPGTVLRLPMVYGPGDRLHRFAAILKQMDDGAREILFEEKYAAWRSPRGFVENVGAAIALAATSERAAGRIYNVAEPESFSELEWARQIADAAGWRGVFTVQPAGRAPAQLTMPGNLEQHWVVDSTRIREELGYRESIACDAAIRQTAEWERSVRDSI